MKTISYSNREDLKRNAKRVKRKLGISHSQALEKLAKEAGFPDYHHLQKAVVDTLPYSGMESSSDPEYKLVNLVGGRIWFAMDVKRSDEHFDQKEFPKRWGIRHDVEKENRLYDDLKKSWEESVGDGATDFESPEVFFNREYRVFSLELPDAKTLFDVTSYAMKIFFFGTEIVFQGDFVYSCLGSPMVERYSSWLKRFGRSGED